MTVVLERLQPSQLQTAQVDIRVRVTSQVNITPFVARQKVNVLMLDKVGNLLHGGEPEMVLSDRLYWRVPVLLSTPSRGLLGQVGAILVNARTGETVADDTTLQDIADHAQRLFASSAL
ncbi:MAG TPA: hypothetical protein ENJ31_11345 [Anaerolineae bacterium]|nr:hypothetical protein [Anaerolineae bacterium]